MVDDLLVKIIPAQVVVAVAGDHLHNPVFDLDHGDIEGAATQVVHQDSFAAMVPGLVGERRRRGFVDHPNHLQPGDLSRLPGGLPLRVVEIGGHCDHRLLHRSSQVGLGDAFQLFQDDPGDLLGGILLTGQGDLFRLAHPALDGFDRPLRIQDILVAGRRTDHDGTVFGHADHRRQEFFPSRAGNDHGLTIPDHRHLGVGGAQVDTDNGFIHIQSPLADHNPVVGIRPVRHCIVHKSSVVRLTITSAGRSS